MVTKKTVKKEKKREPMKNLPKKQKNLFFQGIGRRKEAVSRVRLHASPEKAASGKIIINDKPLEIYFPVAELKELVGAPLRVTGTANDFKVTVKVTGGGFRGQAEATRLGISRALVIFNSEHKRILRDSGYLTRDARVVERKKPGLKKARRAPQWQKR